MVSLSFFPPWLDVVEAAAEHSAVKSSSLSMAKHACPDPSLTAERSGSRFRREPSETKKKTPPRLSTLATSCKYASAASEVASHVLVLLAPSVAPLRLSKPWTSETGFTSTAQIIICVDEPR